MLIPILITLAVIIAIFLVIVAMRPSETQVTRSSTVSAPPGVVFAQVNDFHNWKAWSPWAKMDPDARNSFDGPESGTGAKFAWAGNKKVGEGSMTIIESQPPKLIRIRLDFLKPFKATNVAEFTFTPNGDQTTVTWTMFCKPNFVMKGFCMFMDMDKMVGGDFEKGLAAMKIIAEGAGQPA